MTESKTDRKRRRSSFSVLRELPAVFTLYDVEVKLGLPAEYVSQYCARWNRDRMVSRFANGVYFNLVADPQAKSRRLKEAVDLVVRRPVVLIGASGLHAHGWTTQIPRVTEIAIPVTRNVRNYKRMAGVIGEGRSIEWFNAVMPLCEPGTDGFLLPPPEYVLADMISERARYGEKKTDERGGKKPHIWHGDPDDVDIGTYEPEDAIGRIYEAGLKLGVKKELLSGYMEDMADLSELASEAACDAGIAVP